MRLLGYYMVHTIKNGIKKLFRTRVVVVFAIALVFGLVFGLLGGTIGSLLEGDTTDTVYEDEYIEEEMTPEDTAMMLTVLEALGGGVILLILLANVYGGDKNGSSIFLMSDVNFLFTAPLRPQSVLLFRMILQMGKEFVASLYLLFQLPNLVMNMGLSVGVAVSLFVCWLLTLFLGKLLSVLTYTLAATHPRVRNFIRPSVFGFVALLLVGTYAVSSVKEMTLPEAALWLFGGEGSRYVPLWGWLKGVVGFAIDGQWFAIVLCAIGVVACGGLIAWLAWRMKADFYEDALAHAAETQATLDAASEGGLFQRKKERADRLQRDVFRRGEGAVMFLYKGVINRHRFAKLRVFSNTCITYFGTFLLVSAAIIWLTRGGDTRPADLLVVPAAIVLVMAFFRNLGNPLEADMSGHYLFLVPESARKKLLYALLAGSYDTLMDVLPGLLIATVVLRASIFEALGWLLVILTCDLLLSVIGLFLHLVLPSSLPQEITAMLQLLLRMLAVALPLIVLLVFGISIGLNVALPVTAAINTGLGAVLFLPSTTLLHKGKN